jgi:hypothetical protein
VELKMADFKDWSAGWIPEGHFISYTKENSRIYEYVSARDFAHYEYDWPETIVALATSGPYIPDDLEITKGYDATNKSNQMWQIIFGIKGQVYIYIELPTDIARHGLAKRAKPSSDLREVGHFEEYMSSFHDPSFVTEHFMMRPDTFKISFSAYNPNSIAMPNVRLNIMLNKLITERIGEIVISGSSVVQNPSNDNYREILDKLYKRLVPCRPITLLPVRAPAEASSGE